MFNIYDVSTPALYFTQALFNPEFKAKYADKKKRKKACHVIREDGHYIDRVSRNRVAKDFRRPDDILTAVDVYMKYGRESAARELIKQGLERYPNDQTLQARAAEIGVTQAGPKET